MSFRETTIARALHLAASDKRKLDRQIDQLELRLEELQASEPKKLNQL